MKQLTILSTGLNLILWGVTFILTILYSFMTIIDTQTLNIYVIVGMILSGVVSYGLIVSMDILDRHQV